MTISNLSASFRICLILYFFQGVCFAQGLPRGIEIVTQGHKFPDNSYSLLVQEIGKTTPELSINIDTPRNPASAIKVLTTLAALDTLGPAYYWSTDVFTLGSVNKGKLKGDLLIKGYGDPYLVTENFWKLLQSLKRGGINEIEGDLIIDDSYFSVPTSNPGDFDNKPERSYNVLPNALLINFKATYFHFYPDRNGKTVTVTTDPELGNLNISNNLRIRKARCGGYQRGINFNVPQNGNRDRVLLNGRYPSGCGHYVMSRSVLNPDTFAYGVFASLWQQLGGSFAGSVKKGLAPVDSEPRLSWRSQPLGEVIRKVNKLSNNVMTRQILLTLAAETMGEPGTLENGRAYIKEYLENRNMDAQSLNLVNGAGLSRNTRISSRLMRDILVHANAIPFMPEFVSSLSIMGTDGTARNRLRKRIKSGHAHVKTGTIDHVSAIAGYVDAISGRRFAIVGMVNHPNVHKGPGEELMNALVEWSYRQ